MYKIFVRNWWKENPAWPDGKEPDPIADKEYIYQAETEDEARAFCRHYNKENNPGFLSRKAEYEG